MYEFLLTIKVSLRLPWRSTVGFAKKLLTKIFSTEVCIRDYAHANREAKKLNLKIKELTKNKEEGIELAFDSTGLNVYSTSGYHQRRYGKESLCRKRDQWKKVHLGLELEEQQIVSVVLTESNVNDCEAIEALSRQIKKKVKSVRADGAYDTKGFYKRVNDWGAVTLVPPSITSKTQEELKIKRPKKDYLRQRDEIIKQRQYCLSGCGKH
ncbi:MAG: transposase [Gammaproteobacteria bacterium]|jgi:hypothetical protein|nr:transposase [Gammaproteobacteria bacterium]